MSDYLFYAGLDLGQAADYSALAVVEELIYCPEAGGWVSWSTLTPMQRSDYRAGFGARWRAQTRENPPLWLRMVHRYALRTSYPSIVLDVARRLNRATQLVVDGTGVGAAVVDMFRYSAALPCDLYPVIITGGVKQDRNHVPKRDLIGAVQAVLQTGQLHIAEGTTEAKTFLNEMQTYAVKLTDTGHDTYNARGDSEHDDLVLAVALAVWRRSRVNRGE